MISLYQRLSRIFSKFTFQKVACPVRWPNRHILEILLACRHFGHRKPSGRSSDLPLQAERVGSNSSLYDTKKKKFFKQKNVKINGFASTYNVEILNSCNPELQLEDTESAIKCKLKKLLTELKGFEFVTTLLFEKIESEDKTNYDNFYSSSKAEIIVNESDIDDVFESIYSTIISNIEKSLGKGSGWIIDSVIDHTIYFKLIWELHHPRKGLINIQNIDDNECFQWIIARYLNVAACKPARITKADKVFAKKLDFKDRISIKNQKSKLWLKNLSLNFQILTCIYSLKNLQEVEFLIFRIDIE